MLNPSPSDSLNTDMAAALNTSIVPLGERAWRSILDHIIAVGDEAETSYLEVKRCLDMSGKDKAATAKIAKFLLGAANRLPRQAAQYFQGYAVLVIGSEKGEARGVPRGTEAHELEDRLRPYLGSQFPAFEFGRIALDDDREVLFIIAQPPQDGQPIFPCFKEFHGNDKRDNLEDGAIYVRASSNTRRAKSGEVLALVERAQANSKPPIDLEVKLVGGIHRVDRVEEVLEQLLDCEEEQFNEKLQAEIESTSIPSPIFCITSPSFPRPPIAEDKYKALAAWQRKKTEHIKEGRKYFLGIGLTGAGIRVISRDRFIANPHLTVTFHSCEVFDYLDPDRVDIDKVVEPVIRTQGPFGSSFDPTALHVHPRDYPVDWRNHGDDAEITLTPESFRPNTAWTSNQDDYVIVSRDLEVDSVNVSWALTEDGNDNVTTGEFSVPTENLLDAAELFKAVFLEET